MFGFRASAVRPLVFRRRNGSLDGYKHISGILVIGSLVVVAGAVVGSGPADRSSRRRVDRERS